MASGCYELRAMKHSFFSFLRAASRDPPRVVSLLNLANFGPEVDSLAHILAIVHMLVHVAFEIFRDVLGLEDVMIALSISRKCDGNVKESRHPQPALGPEAIVVRS